MNRRAFLSTAAGGLAAGTAALTGAAGAARAAGASTDAPASAAPADATAATGRDLARRLPRWRGFNLLEKFTLGRGSRPFVETDFAWTREWGFDCARLPMDYRCWTDKDDLYKYDEACLKEIDDAVALGAKYGVHVSLNLHRAPGFCINPPEEKLSLWEDEEAQKQFDAQWAMFAKRYKGVPASALSFDLVNEPARYKNEEQYVAVARRAVAAIRAADPDRLIFADGGKVGQQPVMALADLGIAQSMHGYMPGRVTHYKASWAGGTNWPEPTWPLVVGKETQDRAWVYETRIKPWKELAAKGVGVHMGEWGCYNKTPHAVALAWMKDVGELVKEAGWGWALWNLRGSFGVVDSGRADVTYEDFHGHKLDRAMLELLKTL